LEYLLVVGGLLLLLLGGDLLVKSSVALAVRLKVSTLVIGLTVVSFATSAPELLVSVEAALQGLPEIALGNVIGSNIANIGLILGATALFFKMPVPEISFRKDWVILSLFSILMVLCLANGILSFWEGMLFVVLLAGYNFLKIKASRKENKLLATIDEIEKVTSERMSWWKIIALLVAGGIALRFGAKFLIDGAVPIAQSFGISERVISLSLISIGTSVPELAASLVAAFKKENDISLGNILGSNIFNILAVLGFTALLKPIPVADMSMLYFDGLWMLGFTFVLFPMAILFKRGELSRAEGAVLLLAYALYITLLFY